MSRAANIDDFVKGRMSGPPLQQFQNEMRGDTALAREVSNQQMVLGLVGRQANSNLRAQIQEVRNTYENQVQVSARKVDKASKPVAKEQPMPKENAGAVASIIKVILYVENYRAEVQDLQIQFEQQVDQIGQPSGKVTGARILLTLPLQKNNLMLGWMMDPYKKHNGELSYINSDGRESKRIEFKDAYCVAYNFEYDAFSEKQVKQNALEKVMIVPKEVYFKDAVFLI